MECLEWTVVYADVRGNVLFSEAATLPKSEIKKMGKAELGRWNDYVRRTQRKNRINARMEEAMEEARKEKGRSRSRSRAEQSGGGRSRSRSRSLGRDSYGK